MKFTSAFCAYKLRVNSPVFLWCAKYCNAPSLWGDSNLLTSISRFNLSQKAQSDSLETSEIFKCCCAQLFFFNSPLWHDIFLILFPSLQQQKRLRCLHGWDSAILHLLQVAGVTLRWLWHLLLTEGFRYALCRPVHYSGMVYEWGKYTDWGLQKVCMCLSLHEPERP